jgi:hypothetical protein
MKINYPHVVREWLDDFYSHLYKEGFFTDPELGKCDEHHLHHNFDKIVGEEAFQSWLIEGEVKMEPDKIGVLLFQVIVQSHLEELKKEGIVDSIEDEKGEEIMWVTSKGKKIIK